MARSWIEKLLWFSAIGLGIAALVGLVTSNIETVIKIAVEKVGSKMLGVAVTLGFIEVNRSESTIILRNLKVANPTGYADESLLTAQSIRIESDLANLLQPQIVLASVTVENLAANYELKEGSTNLDAVLAQMPQGGKPIRIDHLIVVDSSVHIRGLPFIGEITLPIPLLELPHLSTAAGQSLPLSDILTQVLQGVKGNYV